MTAEKPLRHIARTEKELRAALTRLHLAVEMLALKHPDDCEELLEAKQNVLDEVRARATRGAKT